MARLQQQGNKGEPDRGRSDARVVDRHRDGKRLERSYERLTRRRLLELSGAAGAAAFIAGCADDDGATTASRVDAPSSLPPTPACDDGDPTPAQTEGPFFKPDSPARTSLRGAGVVGAPLDLSGRVLLTDCEPAAGALLDFWQADGDGVYDNESFRLRGHQFADGAGRFELATVVPGPYPGRTAHIHVMVQPEGGSILTTQLYFPREPGNEADPLFDERLLLDVSEKGDRGEARFDFVLEA
jgi:protocatechuate 3,4-dioxygenase beta subunit